MRRLRTLCSKIAQWRCARNGLLQLTPKIICFNGRTVRSHKFNHRYFSPFLPVCRRQYIHQHTCAKNPSLTYVTHVFFSSNLHQYKNQQRRDGNNSPALSVVDWNAKSKCPLCTLSIFSIFGNYSRYGTDALKQFTFSFKRPLQHHFPKTDFRWSARNESRIEPEQTQ